MVLITLYLKFNHEIMHTHTRTTGVIVAVHRLKRFFLQVRLWASSFVKRRCYNLRSAFCAYMACMLWLLSLA